MSKQADRSQEPEVRMEPSRRDLLKAIGSSMILTTAGVGVLPPVLAQHVHSTVMDIKSLDGGVNYQPKYLTTHEFATMRRLSDMIIPADPHSKGAIDAGAAEYIDFLCSKSPEFAEIFTGGLGWLDAAMMKHDQNTFLSANPEQQTAMLDLIAWRKNQSPELGPGIHFFSWARNVVVDAYYTSPVGIAELGYMGNTGMSEFSVPKEALEYALKRSPFADGA
jgi:gluconate 2-dehydrogenase gamma chain